MSKFIKADIVIKNPNVGLSEISRITPMAYSSAVVSYKIVDLITTMFVKVFTIAYRVIRIYKAYEEGGMFGVIREVNSIISSAFKEACRRAGIKVKEVKEVNFTKLVKAKYIDERTALYLTTLYMAIEADLENLEEASEKEVNKILDAITRNITELENVLIYSEQYTTGMKSLYQEEQASTYVTGSVTYM